MSNIELFILELLRHVALNGRLCISSALVTFFFLVFFVCLFLVKIADNSKICLPLNQMKLSDPISLNKFPTSSGILNRNLRTVHYSFADRSETAQKSPL